ncbi:PDZ and LIM domain protein Zasp isoform X4 [Anthonomus grandis grandis]|uniref:PDZ and LIM domain protein Zasp isoform X4 n=1 Tax=Anthonomus grandis grandis TaxID=2921223 RepID=UPI002164F364|nr:PDZ and LIM domain protein Zasp isoform X4 [Anthonomus grandis grandis]
MATLTTVRLSKGDSPSWGFRLQGGKDFGTPLVIQKVNGGSPAERAGLIAGDSVIRINNTDVFNLLHKEAQDVIVRAGNNFEMVIQRGGSTWKPAVVPVGAVNKPSPVPVQNFSPVTKTSLAALPGENIGAIGTGHNVSAKPFGQVNGAVNGGAPKLVNKQYNTPLKLYSEDAIAETISAQSEVLSTGALGVNFKKNEKNYDATNSAVYRMLKEAENEPTEPTNDSVIRSEYLSATNGGTRRSASPKYQSSSSTNQPQTSDHESATICTDCERVIVGVFVRIKDKNLHVECFKCSTCGSSLKNVGYYNINNKLYCDIHAKSAAIAINNPGVLGDVAPKPPANQISAALSSHLPASSPLSPKTSGYSPTFPSSNVGGPKPFSSVSAPLSPGGSLSRAAPISPGGSLHRAAPLSPQGNFSKPALSPTAHSYTSNSPLSSGAGAGRQTGGITAAPKRGKGLLNAAALPGARVPLCGHCHGQIRGPFITALGKIWCPNHFICATPSCKRPLQDLGFVEERGQLYCEYCFEQYLAPPCSKCNGKIKGDCLKAIGKNFHPECFNCVYCGKLFGNNPFFLEDGNPYCEADWNELFTTKCFACGFPVEAGDRWVEALNNNYHSQCFNCTMCKKNLEGQSFFAKGGRPFCKNHAR